jgi:hypothetical protein
MGTIFALLGVGREVTTPLIRTVPENQRLPGTVLTLKPDPELTEQWTGSLRAVAALDGPPTPQHHPTARSPNPGAGSRSPRGDHRLSPARRTLHSHRTDGVRIGR